MTRAQVLAHMFIVLADTLAEDFDVTHVMHRLAHAAVHVFDATAAGVMLTNPQGELQVIASSDIHMRDIEVLQLQSKEGPCLDAFHQLAPVQASTAKALDRWPVFALRALAEGYRSVSAFPMRLREQTIGVLSIFRSEPQPVWDTITAQALADTAAIGLEHRRALQEAHRLTEELRFELAIRAAPAPDDPTRIDPSVS